jgi:hypothetical protein
MRMHVNERRPSDGAYFSPDQALGLRFVEPLVKPVQRWILKSGLGRRSDPMFACPT